MNPEADVRKTRLDGRAGKYRAHPVQLIDANRALVLTIASETRNPAARRYHRKRPVLDNKGDPGDRDSSESGQLRKSGALTQFAERMNDIQQFARSIRLSSTSKIELFSVLRDRRMAKCPLLPRPHPQERPFLGSGIEELSSDFCTDRDASAIWSTIECDSVSFMTYCETLMQHIHIFEYECQNSLSDSQTRADWTFHSDWLFRSGRYVCRCETLYFCGYGLSRARTSAGRGAAP